MEKKYNPIDDKTFKISEVLQDLFGGSEPLTMLKMEHKPIPLKKKGDVEYEVRWHTTNLERDGHKVVHIDQNRFGETVMIYRLMYDDGQDDEIITLRVKVISKDGVRVPDSNVHIHVDNKHMEIADIKIEGDRVNRGYGSIMMAGLMKLVQQMQIRGITGWISSVDWDHIDRSEHFYRKHGFDCQLDHENKRGAIVWVNRELESTQD
ncbi:hypothetical protein IDH44_15970 [Paenibacillus sp. IB182496]|uniref:Uncharacterized protein n=1 Tax=Paenibacillus sabuli TaxID=2772509 RepID=A0A927GSL3_9BACL|nr:hypothetical protein [Paenibacillus sabuli]MBD2846693.1 hypothetical protein [Paenibacillus sabuli]